MRTPSLPLAVTMGDPSGIGPEIVAAALATRRQDARHLVIGSAAVMKRAAALCGIDLGIRSIAHFEEAAFEVGAVDVLGPADKAPLPDFGRVLAASGRAAFQAIMTGIALANDRQIGGIVTAPINKAALAAAGIRYPGHTEILADYSGVGQASMMLANENVRTVLVTIHCSLRDAIERIDFATEIHAIRAAHHGVRALGVASPRVAVAGLNPHAGEGGLFGSEERTIIQPAIDAARDEGIDASGPWPGDTVFMHARKGQFDVVVAQYHDQGLIPIKFLGIEKGVNITLGLPFVRTSPDHGTAFDIAGKGVADCTSLSLALDYATRLVAARQKEATS